MRARISSDSGTPLREEAARRCTARHRPDLGIKPWREFMARGGPCAFYRRCNVLSYAMARLKTDEIWMRRYNKPKSEAELRAELAPSGRHHQYVIPGGAWSRHTEMAIAERDGDHEKLARFEAEEERVMDERAERVQTAIQAMTPR